MTVLEEIHKVNAIAKRTLRKTPVGKENPIWKALHAEINDLLTDMGYPDSTQ